MAPDDGLCRLDLPTAIGKLFSPPRAEQQTAANLPGPVAEICGVSARRREGFFGMLEDGRDDDRQEQRRSDSPQHPTAKHIYQPVPVVGRARDQHGGVIHCEP